MAYSLITVTYSFSFRSCVTQSAGNPIWDKYEIVGVSFDTSNNPNKKFFKPVYIMPNGDVVACDGTHDFNYDPNKEIQFVPKESIPFYGKPTEPAV